MGCTTRVGRRFPWLIYWRCNVSTGARSVSIRSAADTYSHRNSFFFSWIFSRERSHAGAYRNSAGTDVTIVTVVKLRSLRRLIEAHNGGHRADDDRDGETPEACQPKEQRPCSAACRE